jgi:four helix bundle protein
MKRDLDQRLRKFVQRILNLARHLRAVVGAERIADQISRCGPSLRVGGRTSRTIRFNYAESQAASSRAHFISIIEIAEREARETKAALETIMDVPFVKPSRLTDLYTESCEIVAILTTIAKRAKQNRDIA